MDAKFGLLLGFVLSAAGLFLIALGQYWFQEVFKTWR